MRDSDYAAIEGGLIGFDREEYIKYTLGTDVQRIIKNVTPGLRAAAMEKAAEVILRTLLIPSRTHLAGMAVGEVMTEAASAAGNDEQCCRMAEALTRALIRLDAPEACFTKLLSSIPSHGYRTNIAIGELNALADARLEQAHKDLLIESTLNILMAPFTGDSVLARGAVRLLKPFTSGDNIFARALVTLTPAIAIKTLTQVMTRTTAGEQDRSKIACSLSTAIINNISRQQSGENLIKDIAAWRGALEAAASYIPEPERNATKLRTFLYAYGRFGPSFAAALFPEQSFERLSPAYLEAGLSPGVADKVRQAIADAEPTDLQVFTKLIDDASKYNDPLATCMAKIVAKTVMAITPSDRKGAVAYPLASAVYTVADDMKRDSMLEAVTHGLVAGATVDNQRVAVAAAVQAVLYSMPPLSSIPLDELISTSAALVGGLASGASPHERVIIEYAAGEIVAHISSAGDEVNGERRRQLATALMRGVIAGLPADEKSSSLIRRVAKTIAEQFPVAEREGVRAELRDLNTDAQARVAAAASAGASAVGRGRPSHVARLTSQSGRARGAGAGASAGTL